MPLATLVVAVDDLRELLGDFRFAVTEEDRALREHDPAPLEFFADLLPRFVSAPRPNGNIVPEARMPRRTLTSPVCAGPWCFGPLSPTLLHFVPSANTCTGFGLPPPGIDVITSGGTLIESASVWSIHRWKVEWSNETAPDEVKSFSTLR